MSNIRTKLRLPQTVRKARPRTRLGLGVALLVAALVASLGLYYKPAIETFLRSGKTITVEFDRNYRLVEDQSTVSYAGLDVGIVSDIQRTDDGVVLVSMKVDQPALKKLGSKPFAKIVPNTVLSGMVNVELVPGGGSGAFENDTIPNERSHIPVGLDRILESFPTSTRQSLQNVVRHLDDTLNQGGRKALRGLVDDAPKALKPATAVLDAVQGTRPGVDLPRLVTNFHATAATLSQHKGQLADIVTSLQQVTDTLAEQSPALAAGVERLPAALRATRTGVIDLRGSLNRLTATAGKLRPVARQLDSLLGALDPVLQEARPLLADLQPLLRDTRPVLDELVPVADRGTKVLHDLRGPVLERINGPIADTVMSTWRGSGPYKGSGGGFQADHKFYEELGYLATNLNRVTMYQDRYGSMLGFQVGFNLDSLAPTIGGPLSLHDLVRHLRQATGGQ